VFEIRAHDQVGLLHQLSKTISATHASIVGAKVTTLGSEVIDVLYVQSSEAGQLNAAQTEELVQLLQQSLST
jgi:UTP:GlnB (protein PII) uridylyltransferase